MNKLSLNGKWKMRRLDTEQWLEATVPGSVYGDLLNAGQMPDPFFRDNEKDALKLSEYDYEYCRIFHIDSSLYKYDKLFLVCSGLDTLAEISVNGQFLAKTFNMHRKYEFDIKPMLMVGENTISIVFRSPVNYISQKQKESPLWGVDGTIKGYAHIRKAHYMFGWDWGPQLPDMGIWRDICIIGYSSQKFNDILISQSHQKEKVKLDIRIKLDKWALVQSDLRVAIKYPNGEFLVKTMSFMESESTVSMEIENPELWWPNGYGKQPLYEINIELLDNGRQSDFRSYKIGLRTLTVTQKDDQWGRSFAFTVNGVEIFAMGANYIPEDNILSRCSAERTEKLIKSCVEANYNCLR
ncbi:MAG: glycoside hydrolase family 2 protein, partial [Clostridia bacterium]|nr:glycoside hydrolase family 2 protein [Clostridia bacterium]